MKNLLALGGAALLVFAVAGWYLGWYQISSTRDSEGHPHLTIDVNKDKVSDDVHKGADKLRDALSKKEQEQTVRPSPMPPEPFTSVPPPPPLPSDFNSSVKQVNYEPRVEPPKNN